MLLWAIISEFCEYTLNACSESLLLHGPSAWLFLKDYAIKLKFITYNLFSINELCSIGDFLSLCKFELLILSIFIMWQYFEGKKDWLLGPINNETGYGLKLQSFLPWTRLQVCGSKRISCNADLYTVSRCCTRGESEDHTSKKACKTDPPWVWSPG